MAFKIRRSNMKKNDNYTVCFNNKKYCFDLDKIKEFCFEYSNSDAQNIESEITDVSSEDEETKVMSVTQKVIRETKTCKQQNDVLMHDILKTLMFPLLENAQVEGNFMDFSTALAFNTCLSIGILKEVE